MSDCVELESLPSSIWKLKSLEELYLDRCSNLENLSKTREFSQSSRSQLHTNGQFSPLKRLSIRGCEKIQLLPELSGTLLKFLDVSHCKSLETVFDLEQPCRFQNFECFGGSKFFFFNCRKLDVRRSNIAALAKMKIQAEATYSYFEIYRYYQFEMVYPGCEIPNWIKHQNMGHSITIQLPVNKRFLGFALCAVVPAGDSFDCEFCFKNTSGDSFSWKALGYSKLSLESEHVILSYASFTSDQYNEMVEKLGCRGDYYDVTFDISYCTCNIKRPDVLKCGLVPLYAQNVNYKGLETPLDESETTEVTINLTEDEREVSVHGCQVEYPDRETVLRTYRYTSAEIFEVDTLALSAFGGASKYSICTYTKCPRYKASNMEVRMKMNVMPKTSIRTRRKFFKHRFQSPIKFSIDSLSTTTGISSL